MKRFAILSIAMLAAASGVDGGHWAFQPVGRPQVPPAELSPIDAFVQARLADANFQPAPRADRRTQIRRLFLDMHGLPPTPGEVAEFVAALDPEAAYRQLVDAVLASPRYGERWAQHWLDLVRYADTHGFEVNTERANAWPYRDYVIRALNEDRPYDQFITDQLAGDTTGEDAATGFLVASAVLLPGQIGKDEASKRLARQDSLDEIVVGTSDTFLALSVGCARCHDHKFDPIPQRDYYTMQAFFAGVDYGERAIRNPGAESQRAEVSAKISAIEKRLDGVQPLASTGFFLLIDDEDPTRTTHLKTKNGHGVNPEGAGRGYRDDPGGAAWLPNLSAGRYTWWDNKAGEDVLTYHPGIAGKFRIWLSWGVHGSGVHTRDARYVLDLDGDLATSGDQNEIANVDQYYLVGVDQGESEQKPLWSGLYDAGVHTLREASQIVLRGGETGTGITADSIVLTEAGGSGAHPRWRAPVDPGRNVERFAPVEAKFVRFSAHATTENNRYEPCIDELEIFDSNGDNVALSGEPTSSGNRAGDPQHQLEQVNDGNYGNGKSWISDEIGQGWVQIELAQATVIDRVVWGRDRQGQFKDRLAHRYDIEIAKTPGDWITVASSADRVPPGTPFDAIAALARDLPEGAEGALRHDLAELDSLKGQRAELEQRDKVYGGTFRQPDRTYVLNRGDPEQKGERVGASVLTALDRLALPLQAPEQERRLALARWIANAENPLTARVFVNRVWQNHFGRGLVNTPSDFGLNGAKPSHPKLLDWLAAEFVTGGWSMKQLHRQILLSDTYRQSSRIEPKAQAVDGDCRLLWRFPSRRLEAEAIRDGILAVNGQLNLKMGGPGFNFFSSRGGLNGFPVVESFKAEGLRRMIYAHKVRMERIPVFGAFDCPDAGRAMPRRSQSTTAIQALNLFNSQFVIDQSQALVERVRAELGGPAAPEPYIDRFYQLALARDPSPTERSASAAVVREHGLEVLARVLYNCNEFLFLP